MKNYVDVIFKNNALSGSKVAIVDKNADRETTWEEIYLGACKVASYAVSKNIKGLVPICMERSAENVISMLGLGLAGIGIAPLSDHTPESRIKLIENQTCNSCWTISDYDKAMKSGVDSFDAVEFKDDDSAYVVFTSGSTGMPKGVMLSNDTVEKSYKRMAGDEFLNLEDGDKVLQNASFSFVALMIDLYAPLYKGCVSHILPEEGRLDTDIMTRYINEHNITSMFITPKPLKKLGEMPSMKVICVGGERVSKLGPKGYKLMNVWGMSETAALAVGYNISEPMEKTPIGKPSRDFEAYIVDENGNLADEGELLLSGAVAFGYYNREDLSKEVFTENPYPHKEGFANLLHTGDIVKRLDDGNLMFVNRKDFMIKINGQRVEPGEAESVIEKIPGVTSAAVKGFTESDGRSYLCAYYVCDDGITEKLIRDELQKNLHSYMIPSYFVKMEALPLNSNGKIDRKALKAPEIKSQTEYEAPTTDDERAVCRAFEKVLKIEKIGINDDFLYLGGDSIGAMSVAGISGISSLHGSDILKGRTPKVIAQLICSKGENKKRFAADNNKAELTDSQLGIYLECVKCPESTMYNVPVYLSFDCGSFERHDIKKAVDKVISLHGALVSHFEVENEKVFMVRDIMPTDGICEVEENENFIKEEYDEKFIIPFNLEKGPLVRAKAFVSKNKVHIYLDMHHAVSDGSSVALIAKQISEVLSGKKPDAEAVDAYALYELDKFNMENGRYEKAKDYFNALLSGVEIDSNIIQDKTACTDGVIKSRHVDLRLDDIDLLMLRKNGITESSFFMSVYGYALAKITGQKASLFAVAESGRKSSTVSNTVSMMVRTLPVYMDIDENQTADELMLKTQKQFFDSVDNDIYPFSSIVSEYGVSSDVMFVYQSEMLSDFEAEFGKVNVEILDTNSAFAKLSTSVFKDEKGYYARFEYREDLYDDETIQRFSKLYENTAKAFAENKTLKDIRLIDDKDTEYLNELNSVSLDYDKTKTIVDVFRKVAKENPDKVLVVSEETRITYAEADDITDRLSAYIHSLGIGKDDAVSVLIPRCEYMVLASIGIMKAGAMYQPLDPSYPSERLSFMRKDAGSRLLIADKNLINMLPEIEGDVLYTEDIPSLPKGNMDFEAPGIEDGYVLLYTSGTTGTPKGCMLVHKNLTALVHAFAYVTRLDSSSVVGAYASYGFDAHMVDLYPTILRAGEIHIITDRIRLDMPALKDYCENNGLTHMVMTTQLVQQFTSMYKEIKGMKCFLTGGEKLVSYKPSDSYRLINAYGPTESTVMATYFEVDKEYEDIPIGKTLPNTKLYVVDEYGRRMPIGAPGELVICGPQVAKGYLNRKEQTEKVFVNNTFDETVMCGYERCYKTGDIVRFKNDGYLAFIGRRDLQVKIRGFRIELGEVEKIIRQFPGIKDATVVARDDPSGGKCLNAYVVADEEIDIEKLNDFIREEKPPYMVPAVTMQISEMPLTVNGKVDKKKLPVPEIKFEDALMPQTDIQQRIYNKVAEVVGNTGFGVNTDIFMVGLSSIGSIHLCSLLSDEFNIPFQIRNLKKYDTVEKLEQFVLKSQKADEESNNIDSSKPSYGKAYPISKTMEGIFVECVRRPDSTFYNIPCLLKFSDDIDENRLADAIQKAVNAHPYMMSELFTDEDGKVCQHLKVNAQYLKEEINTIKVSSIFELSAEMVKPFELTNSRLFKITLIKAEENYLFLNFHHIIADGTSLEIFIKDIEKAYEGKSLAIEKYSGFDVAQDEEKSRTSEDLNDAKQYFSNLLEGLDHDFIPSPDKLQSTEASSGKISLSQEIADAKLIRKFCENNKLSANAFYLSVFGFVLSKYAGTDYSVFNTVYNGRNDSRKTDTFAMLVKTLPVVCDIEKESVLDLVRSMAKQLMDTMANDLYSYAEIAKTFGVNNDVMFIYQGDSFERDSFCGKEAVEIAMPLSESKTEMSLEVKVQNEKLIYDFEYNSEKYTEGMIRAILSAFDKACHEFTIREKLSEISLLSDKALEYMEKFNSTEYEYDKSETITGMFKKQVKAHGEHLCVAYKNTKRSYKEVGALVDKISLFLMEKGIGADDVVSILINRDENMIITSQGVIASGAAYLGLDPTYPSDRLEFMISDSGSKYLVADRTLMEKIPGYKGEVLYTDEIDSLPFDENEMNRYRSMESHRITPENNALIVYSSGTTGLPKGSVLQHKAIVCYYHNYTQDLEIGPKSNVATYASFGFDGGAQDALCVPMSGASVYVIPDDIRMDLSSLEKFYVMNKITNGFMTTQVGCMFISSTKCKTLKHFMVGGEKLIPTMPPSWVSFVNGYGPSETMCYVNHYRIISTEVLQPIGKVSRNTKEYIIDKYGNRLPIGACGELCISSGQIGKGYLNREEKTAEVFVDNPFTKEPGYEKMYRTGDVVRELPDGNYDFVGRRDGQVKIRGFRIELGEVEQQIRKFDGVEKAVVHAFDNPSGGKFLAAYVVMDKELDVNELKSFIASEKPDYMVPPVIMKIDDIPLTSNGKVDTRKLPKPELGALKQGAEPADETEEKICDIFAQVLGLEKVYADDDFFEIGGSSISAIQVIVKCEQAGFEVVYKHLFANPTAQKLAAFLHGARENDVEAADLENDDGYDYSALSYNVIENLPNIRNDGIGNVLVTGATGFLGSHVFHEILSSTDNKVICIVRSKPDMDAETRLKMMMVYYFEDWYQDALSERVTVVDGEIEDDNTREKLKDMSFDTIINCAANVKHFAAGDALVASNFEGVEKLISLAEEHNAKLIQISSVSVGGESVNGSVPEGYLFSENDLNIGQSLENKYIYSKYLAEQAVIDAVSKKRIRGKIIRLGNLQARVTDSEFQVNAGTNGFLRQFIGFAKLGCFPVDKMDEEIEFSPVDCVAKAVIMLAGTPDKFTVFHARNCNFIHYGYFLKAIQNAGVPIEVVDDDEFEKRLSKALENEKDVEDLGGIIAYRNNSGVGDEKEKRVQNKFSIKFTTKALYRLGFAWPLISNDYLDEMVNVLKEMNFFSQT